MSCATKKRLAQGRTFCDDISHSLVKDFAEAGIVVGAAGVALDDSENRGLLILMRPKDGRVAFRVVRCCEDVDMGIEVHVFKDFVVNSKVVDSFGDRVFAANDEDIDVRRMKI